MNKRAWLMSMAAVAGSVAAQDQEQDQEQGQLEVVTVTAERRSEDIRKVPSSISTVSGADLDVLSTGGQDVRVLASRVPSLNVESSFGRAFPRFYIRGYGNGDFRLNASQPVSLIYDDVVQENPILKGFPIFDLDQIEVLRGPQGTLFGRNTIGGAILVSTVEPGEELGGTVRGSLGSDSLVDVFGAIDAPIGDTVKGYNVTSWIGVAGPARLPAPFVSHVNAELKGMLADREIGKRLREIEGDPQWTTPEDFKARVVDDVAKWTKVVQDANIPRI